MTKQEFKWDQAALEALRLHVARNYPLLSASDVVERMSSTRVWGGDRINLHMGPKDPKTKSMLVAQIDLEWVPPNITRVTDHRTGQIIYDQVYNEGVDV